MGACTCEKEAVIPKVPIEKKNEGDAAMRDRIIAAFPPKLGMKVFRCVEVWENRWRITYYNPATDCDLTSKFIVVENGKFNIIED